jgi:uncharacterized membrane protein
MAVLGLLLLVVVVLAVIAALFRGGDSVHVDLEWFSIRTDASVVFFSGAAATLLFVLGAWLVLGGLKRSRRRRAELKALRQRAEASEKSRAQVAAEHPASTSTPEKTRELRNGPDEHFDSAPRDP